MLTMFTLFCSCSPVVTMNDSDADANDIDVRVENVPPPPPTAEPPTSAAAAATSAGLTDMNPTEESPATNESVPASNDNVVGIETVPPQPATATPPTTATLGCHTEMNPTEETA